MFLGMDRTVVVYDVRKTQHPLGYWKNALKYEVQQPCDMVRAHNINGLGKQAIFLEQSRRILLCKQWHGFRAGRW